MILSIKNISKTYTTYQQEPTFWSSLKNFFHRTSLEITALHPTSFEIKKGEVVGVLGPNGAGKTTTLKILTGLVIPTTGQVVAMGKFNPSQRPREYLKRIGMVMGQRQQLLSDIPALDSFFLAKALYEIDDGPYQERLKNLCQLLEVEDKIRIPVRKLSLGERMKLELVLALIHMPEILFLDEPTIGLDFHAAKVIRQFLRRLNQELKMTILLTSHYNKDIEELCDRVLLINRGQLKYDGPLAGMDARIKGQRVVELVFANPEVFEKFATSITKNLEESGLAMNTSIDQADLKITIVLSTNNAQNLLESVFQKLPPNSLTDLRVSEQPLDDIFERLYSETI